MGKIIQGMKKRITETTIALIWKKQQFDEQAVFQVYCDGQIVETVKSTNCTLKRLQSGTTYHVKVEAVDLAGNLIAVIDEADVKTEEIRESVVITDFGAVGDGKTLNTQAIQSAIDACPKNGKVIVPEGKFLTGALHLKSDMTLCIKQDGVILGSSRLEDYPIYQYRFEGLETNCYASLINAGIRDKEEVIENITIEGHGAIDASGSKLRQLERDERAGQPGRAICIRNAKNVYLKDITIKQSPAWCVHFIYSQEICCNHVMIYTRADENGNIYEGIANGDGIDIDSCRHVDIIHSVIATQDDCIAIKSGRNEEGRQIAKPTEHVHISDCLFKTGFGIAVGSEMSAGIRDVTVHDCVFQNTYSIMSIKAPRPRGGVIEDVLCEDCIHFNYDTIYEDCEWFRGAIYVDQFYSYKDFNSDEKKPVGVATPEIRNITFRNLEVDTVTGNAIYLVGLPEMPLKNITLDHVTAKGKNGIVIRNVEGLEQKNVSIIMHKPIGAK